MNRFKLFLVIVVNTIIQSTILSRFDIAGARVNLSIPLIIALASFNSPIKTSYTSLFIGLLEDISYSNVLGVRALIYFLIAFSVSEFLNRTSYSQFWGILITIFSTLFAFLGISLIYGAMGHDINIVSYLKGPILIEMLLNTILYFVTYQVFNLLNRNRGY